MFLLSQSLNRKNKQLLYVALLSDQLFEYWIKSSSLVNVFAHGSGFILLAALLQLTGWAGDAEGNARHEDVGTVVHVLTHEVDEQ